MKKIHGFKHKNRIYYYYDEVKIYIDVKPVNIDGVLAVPKSKLKLPFPQQLLEKI